MRLISTLLAPFAQRLAQRVAPSPHPTLAQAQPSMLPIAHEAPPIDMATFTQCLHASDTYYAGVEGRKAYIDSSIPRLYRAYQNMVTAQKVAPFIGPTLDVASGWGILYPIYRAYFPQMLPYFIAEMADWQTTIDGDAIEGCRFECERDRLTFADDSFGTVCFFDCLEHLIVDPVWPILEFNRILRMGGQIIVNTPNATGAFRLLSILRGDNPATVAEIKPASIYQRHNREWTPTEVRQLLECCGFGNFRFATNDYLLSPVERTLLNEAANLNLLNKPPADFGPELFVIAEKVIHRAVDTELPKELRWPAWLYTEYDAYRKRPKVFPVNIADDYA